MNIELRRLLPLYLVTDEALPIEVLLKRVEAAVKGGVTIVQLREKQGSSHDFYTKSIQLKGLLDPYKVPLIINDRVDIALACGASGVHVGQQDIPISEVRRMIPDSMILGASARTLMEAKTAEEAGADYLGAGALFPTSTKKDAKLLQLDQLKEITREIEIPIVGIGGITTDNVRDLKDTGIAGVAVVSGILKGEDSFEKASLFKEKLKSFIS